MDYSNLVYKIAVLLLFITLDNHEVWSVASAAPMELSITEMSGRPAVSLQLNLDADIDSYEEDDSDEDDTDDNQRTVSLSSLISASDDCPSGFVRHKKSCYHIVESNGAMTWDIASAYCRLRDSELVDIQSESEQIFIENLISTRQERAAFWIGANNRKGRGAWEWSSGQPMTYTLWVSHWSSLAYEIDSGSCALIDNVESNQWMFWPCNNNFYMTGKQHDQQTGIGFICEQESPRNAHRIRHRRKRRRRRRKKNRRRRRNHIRRYTGQNLLNLVL